MLKIASILSVFILSVLALLFLTTPSYRPLTIRSANVTFHQFGIPQIRAQNLQDAYFALGYVVASERLFEMAKKRAVSSGRLGQLVGQEGKNLDIFFRELGLDRLCQEIAQRISVEDPALFKILSNYAAGVNYFVNQSFALPFEFQILRAGFQKWSVKDCLLIFKLLQLHLSQGIQSTVGRQRIKDTGLDDRELLLLGNLSSIINDSKYYIVNDDELRQTNQFKRQQQELKNKNQTLGKLSQESNFTQVKNQSIGQKKQQSIRQSKTMGAVQDVPLIVKETFQEAASNNWVVSSRFTKANASLLANDPHLNTQIPTIWYKAQIIVDSQNYQVIGNFMQGFPFALVGKSKQVAVGVTTIYADCADLYRQKLKGDLYEFNGTQVALQKSTQIIRIKGGQQYLLTTYKTHRGPLISRAISFGKLYFFKTNISLAWTGFNTNFTTVRFLFDLGRMTQHQFLARSKTLMDGPTQNAVFILKNNSIGYFASGRYPITPKGPQSYILDGTVPDYDWKGLLPPQTNLRILDPEKGFIVTANSQPVSRNYHLNTFQSSPETARMVRISKRLEQLTSRGKITSEQMQELQFDTVDEYCLKVIKEVSRSFDELAEFDCNFKSDSVLATTYTLLLKHLAFTLYGQHANLAWYNSLLKKLNHIHIHRQKLRTLLHNDPDYGKPFGSFLKIVYPHALSRVRLLDWVFSDQDQGVGNQNTINVGKNRILEGKNQIYHTANMRMVASLQESSKSYWSSDLGQSSHLLSPHRRDFKRKRRVQMRLLNDHSLLE